MIFRHGTHDARDLRGDLIVIATVEPYVEIVFCSIGEIVERAGGVTGADTGALAGSESVRPILYKVGADPRPCIPQNGDSLVSYDGRYSHWIPTTIATAHTGGDQFEAIESRRLVRVKENEESS